MNSWTEMGSRIVAPPFGDAMVREMIEFAGLHGIKLIIEEFPMTVEGITEAMEKLKAGKMRYRGVLVAA